MDLTFNGHACVTIQDSQNRVLVMDPYLSGALGGKISFRPVRVRADWVTVSHYHSDHCHVSSDLGSPTVVDQKRQIGDMTFDFRPTYHDNCGGCRMGMTHMVTTTLDGLRIAHLGDIGCDLTPEDVAFIGDVDVLLWPTGGVYTLGPQEAQHVLDTIKPQVAIPMHYETPGCELGLATVEETLERLNLPVRRFPSGGWSSADGLPSSTEVWVLEPTHGPS